MSLGNGEIQAVSVLATLVLSGGLTFAVGYLSRETALERPKWDDMESIEASIAYKKTPKKQPQKRTSQPPEKPKDEGISRDDTKKPIEGCTTDAQCKPDETCKDKRCEPKKAKPPKTPDTSQVFADHPHPSDDDSPVGEPTTEPGDFNGEKYGWAPLTSGHPFWQQFARDLRENFSLPAISVAEGTPVGCFHITPDGNIVDTELRERSGSADLDDAAERAIRAVQKLRNLNPQPVPTELLGAIRQWTCTKLNPKEAN